MKRYLIFDQLGEYVEDAIASETPELLDGQQAVEVELFTEIAFHRPILLDGEIIEGKTAADFEADAFIASLVPSAEDQAAAEFEIKTITLLVELGVI